MWPRYRSREFANTDWGSPEVIREAWDSVIDSRSPVLRCVLFSEIDSREFGNRAPESETDGRPEPDGRPGRRAVSLMEVKNKKMNPMSIDLKESSRLK